jgi:hypothetical protein
MGRRLFGFPRMLPSGRLLVKRSLDYCREVVDGRTERGERTSRELGKASGVVLASSNDDRSVLSLAMIAEPVASSEQPAVKDAFHTPGTSDM